MHRSSSAPRLAMLQRQGGLRLPPLDLKVLPTTPLEDAGVADRGGSCCGDARPKVVSRRRLARAVSCCSTSSESTAEAATRVCSEASGSPSRECAQETSPSQLGVASANGSSTRRRSSLSDSATCERAQEPQGTPPPQLAIASANGSSARRQSASACPIRAAAATSCTSHRDPPLSAQRSGKIQGVAWLKGKPLGAGSFGTVCKAMDPATSRIFAVKEVALGNSAGEAATRRERLGVELSICQALRHKNVVSYLGHDWTEQSVFIYLEYVPGGSMASWLGEFGPLAGASLKTATLSALEGLDYLHTRSPPVVHRDLKAANLLVDLDMTVKLADFGCSKWSTDTKSFTTLGSVPWMAPEVITQAEGHGRKADIWSFGCTVIEMATAGKPWGDSFFDSMLFALNHIANSGKTPAIPAHAPLECCELISSCTRRSQELRPSTTRLLKHPFLAPAPTTARKARQRQTV